MTPTLILLIFIAYTLLLFAVTYVTARRANHQSFYIGNKVSPWFVVAYGMIGASFQGLPSCQFPVGLGKRSFHT